MIKNKMKLVAIMAMLFYIGNSCKQKTSNDDTFGFVIQSDSLNVSKTELIQSDLLPDISSNHSFIDLSISSKDLKRSNYFSCRGMLIQESSDSDTPYAISQIAIDQKNCNSGISKIFLKKKVGMDGKSAIFKIIDEINVSNSDNNATYHFTRLKIENDVDEKLYVIRVEIYKDSLLQIKEAWYVNHLSGKFESFESNKIMREEDFYETDY